MKASSVKKFTMQAYHSPQDWSRQKTVLPLFSLERTENYKYCWEKPLFGAQRAVSPRPPSEKDGIYKNNPLARYVFL